MTIINHTNIPTKWGGWMKEGKIRKRKKKRKKNLGDRGVVRLEEAIRSKLDRIVEIILRDESGGFQIGNDYSA